MRRQGETSDSFPASRDRVKGATLRCSIGDRVGRSTVPPRERRPARPLREADRRGRREHPARPGRADDRRVERRAARPGGRSRGLRPRRPLRRSVVVRSRSEAHPGRARTRGLARVRPVLVRRAADPARRGPRRAHLDRAEHAARADGRDRPEPRRPRPAPGRQGALRDHQRQDDQLVRRPLGDRGMGARRSSRARRRSRARPALGGARLHAAARRGRRRGGVARSGAASCTTRRSSSTPRSSTRSGSKAQAPT